MGLNRWLTPGTWWFKSKSDPRWNTSGHASVGMFSMTPDAKAALEVKKAELGEPPEDLEWGYMKD